MLSTPHPFPARPGSRAIGNVPKGCAHALSSGASDSASCRRPSLSVRFIFYSFLCFSQLCPSQQSFQIKVSLFSFRLSFRGVKIPTVFAHGANRRTWRLGHLVGCPPPTQCQPGEWLPWPDTIHPPLFRAQGTTSVARRPSMLGSSWKGPRNLGLQNHKGVQPQGAGRAGHQED